MGGIRRKSAAMIVAALAAAGPANAEDPCAAFEARFEAALAAQDFSAAMALEDEIKRSAACGNLSDAYRAQRASRQVELAETLKTNPARQAQREALLREADEPHLLWAAAYALGSLHMEKKRYREAAEAFERAIALLASNGHPDPETAKTLVDAAYMAKSYADSYVDAPKTTRGETGGSLDRAIGLKQVPLPIQFETGSDELTPAGRQYAGDLADAINQQHLETVILEGHTDERGGAAYNMALSRRRVERVAAYLRREKGVTAHIETHAKGKSEPFVPQESWNLSKQQLWELNRRVVWKRD